MFNYEVSENTVKISATSFISLVDKNRSYVEGFELVCKHENIKYIEVFNDFGCDEDTVKGSNMSIFKTQEIKDFIEDLINICNVSVSVIS